jgi:hypothetical protein
MGKISIETLGKTTLLQRKKTKIILELGKTTCIGK